MNATITHKDVFIFVGTSTVSILLLYFFATIMTHVYIGLFAVYGGTTLNQTLFPHVRSALMGLQLNYDRTQVARFTTTFISAFVVGCWLYTRFFFEFVNLGCALQNVIGVTIILDQISLFPLANLRQCTLLYGCMLVYDVVMVFFAPVMETVMLGGHTTEAFQSGARIQTFPMMFRLPCKEGEIWLGFGDLLIPGLFMSYLRRFDRFANRCRPSTLHVSHVSVAICGYLVGLVITFVVCAVFEHMQPALLYLLPCTWLPVALYAKYHNLFTLMWVDDLLL